MEAYFKPEFKSGCPQHSTLLLTLSSTCFFFVFFVFFVSFCLIERKMADSHPVNNVYHKILLNENESYLVIVASQILLVTSSNVYIKE